MSQLPSKKVSERVKRLTKQTAVALPSDLTYIASQHDACENAGLTQYVIPLPVHQRAWRYIFATDAFLAWFRGQLPSLVIAKPYGEDAPQIQVESEMSGFVYGHELRDEDDFRWLQPRSDHVWEIKTDDIRLFGWFCEQNYLVLHAGCAKEKLEKWQDYQPFINSVVSFRQSLSAMIPSYSTGGYRDVVSNRPRSVR